MSRNDVIDRGASLITPGATLDDTAAAILRYIRERAAKLNATICDDAARTAEWRVEGGWASLRVRLDDGRWMTFEFEVER